MAYQVMLRRKLPSRVVREHLEDALTSSVVGAIAYGPPTMAQDWLRSVAGLEDATMDLDFVFWRGLGIPGGGSCKPDVVVTDRTAHRVLVVEAKQGQDHRSDQLIDQGVAVAAAHPGLPLHLLTISDRAVPTAALGVVKRDRTGLFVTTEHVSWSDLYRFLESREDGAALHSGDRRLIVDALEFMRTLDREPFRAMSREEVNRMGREMPAMYSIPKRVQAIHTRLERSVHALEPPLYTNDPERKVSIDSGGRSFDRPDSWLPHCITLPYGPTAGKRHGRYFFVRVLLDRSQIWVGYSMPRYRLKSMLEKPAQSKALVRALRSGGLKVAAVQAEPGQPFGVVRAPVSPTRPALIKLNDDDEVHRIDLVRLHPRSLLSEEHADEVIEAELLEVITTLRSTRVASIP